MQGDEGQLVTFCTKVRQGGGEGKLTRRWDRGIKSTLLRAVGRNIKIPDADYASGTYKIVGGEGIEPPLCHAELSSFNIAFPVHPFS